MTKIQEEKETLTGGQVLIMGELSFSQQACFMGYNILQLLKEMFITMQEFLNK